MRYFMLITDAKNNTIAKTYCDTLPVACGTALNIMGTSTTMKTRIVQGFTHIMDITPTGVSF